MIPSGNAILSTKINMVRIPSEQYRMDLNKSRILGVCDGLESVKQSIFKVLNSERYQYIIYSWNYGIELMDLYGKTPMFVCPELEKRVKDALLQDDRITKVDGFEFDVSKRSVVSAKFTVHTIFGDLEEEMVVNI
jgi:hypothetical protein